MRQPCRPPRLPLACSIFIRSYSEISFFSLASCPVDNGTRYTHTMTDTQRFQLIPFRWIANYTLVYLHCNVIVCHKDQPSRCSKGCQSSNPRHARSVGNEEEHRVTLGPVMLRETQQSESRILYKGNLDSDCLFTACDIIVDCCGWHFSLLYWENTIFGCFGRRFQIERLKRLYNFQTLPHLNMNWEFFSESSLCLD